MEHQTLIEISQAFGLLAGAIGQWLVGEKRISGFYVWLLSNIAIFYVQWASHLHIIAGMFVLNAILCIRSIRMWRREEHRGIRYARIPPQVGSQKPTAAG